MYVSHNSRKPQHAVMCRPHQSAELKSSYSTSCRTLLYCAGGVCKHRASDPVAAVTVDALHSALTDPEQCKHLLLDTYQVASGETGNNTDGGFGGALRGLRGQLTSQLTLGACLFRLCAQVSVCPCCFTWSMNGPEVVDSEDVLLLTGYGKNLSGTRCTQADTESGISVCARCLRQLCLLQVAVASACVQQHLNTA